MNGARWNGQRAELGRLHLQRSACGSPSATGSNVQHSLDVRPGQVRRLAEPTRSPQAVKSIAISAGRRTDLICARNRAPSAIGPDEIFFASSIRGLYRGSLRSSATKSNTSSTGRSMTISPSNCAMPPRLCLRSHSIAVGDTVRTGEAGRLRCGESAIAIPRAVRPPTTQPRMPGCRVGHRVFAQKTFNGFGTTGNAVGG